MWWCVAALAVEQALAPGGDLGAAVGTPEVDVLLLEEGEYTGSFSIDGERVLEIRGRGADRTRLVLDDSLEVRSSDGPVKLLLRDLALVGSGDRPLLYVEGDDDTVVRVSLLGVHASGGGVRQGNDGYGDFVLDDAPIEVDRGGVLDVLDSVLSGNVGAFGGHVAVTEGHLQIERSSLVGGVASERGGAVHLTDGATAEILDSWVGMSTAREGAAIYADGDAEVRLRRSRIEQNVGEDSGAVHVDGARLVATDSWFGRNRGANGGAVRGRSVSIVRSTFVGNEGTAVGAVWCEAECAVRDSVFLDSVGATGAALYLAGLEGRFERNAFCGSSGGPALAFSVASADVTSSLFWRNTGGDVRVDVGEGEGIQLRNLVFAEGSGGPAVDQVSGVVGVSGSMFAWHASGTLVSAATAGDVDVDSSARWESPGAITPGVGVEPFVERDPAVHVEPSADGEGRRCRLADWKLTRTSPLVGAAGGDDIGIHALDDAPEPREDADGDGLLAPYDCDDGDPDQTDPLTVYPNDHDSDGYADGAGAGPSFQACPGPGRAPDLDDCDDRDARVHPGAREDVGGVDRDCDTWIDPARPLRGHCSSLGGGQGALGALLGLLLVSRRRRSA